MRYFPHTDDDRRAMLDAVGVATLDDLHAGLPDDCRRTRALNLPAPLDEWNLTRKFEAMAADAGGDWRVYADAGSQPHAVPAAVEALAGRSEWVTAYTPYQPEIQQGTLQAMFEFQTLVARLAGLPVANASLYDGATALAEAANMARRVTRRHVVAVSELAHPHWRDVLATYFAPCGEAEIVTLPADTDGRTDLTPLRDLDAPAALLIQSPNFFGIIEDIEAAAGAVHAGGGLLVAAFSEPYAYGLLKSPGALGADIVVGEGQGLGLPQGFGGPGLGLMACRAEYMRQIPGRLVGQTVDVDGKRGFVLTLAAREQHIRRGKAVSNVCTNAGLCATTAAIQMAALGRDGFRQMAAVNRDRAEHLKRELVALGFAAWSAAPTFNEFVLRAPPGFAAVHRALQQEKILAGLPLANFFPGRDLYADAWLFGVTETKTRADLDDLTLRIREGLA